MSSGCFCSASVQALGMGGFHCITVYRAPNFHGTRTSKVTVLYGTVPVCLKSEIHEIQSLLRNLDPPAEFFKNYGWLEKKFG